MLSEWLLYGSSLACAGADKSLFTRHSLWEPRSQLARTTVFSARQVTSKSSCQHKNLVLIVFLFFCLFIAGCFVHKTSFCYRISGFQERQWNHPPGQEKKSNCYNLRKLCQVSFILQLWCFHSDSFYCICVVGINIYNMNFLFVCFLLSLLEIFPECTFYLMYAHVFFFSFFLYEYAVHIRHLNTNCLLWMHDQDPWCQVLLAVVLVLNSLALSLVYKPCTSPCTSYRVWIRNYKRRQRWRGFFFQWVMISMHAVFSDEIVAASAPVLNHHKWVHLSKLDCNRTVFF